MHHGLRISEIVDAIVSHLDPMKWADGGTVAALARTSKSVFHDAALDALWRDQDTIIHLLRCMPSDLWKTIPASGGRKMRLRRSIVPSDWERLMNYSYRIKSLQCRHGSHDLAETFETLRGAVPGGHLLPNLEALKWHHYDRMDPSHIELLLSPRLSSISLSRCNAHTQQSVLPTLTRRCPALRQVSIRVGNTSSLLAQPPISIFVGSLSHVTHLDLPDCALDAAAFLHVGQLTTLEIIELVLPASLYFPHSTDGTMFPNLRVARLKVLSEKGRAVAKFLRTWANPPVESFSVQFDHMVAAEYIEELYRCLATHCPHPSLKTICVAGPHAYPRDEWIGPDSIQSGSLIRHLFCFTNLVSLWIYPPAGFDLDDDTTIDMARAWPHLEVLSLVPNHPEFSPRLTLLGLYALAHHCRHLRTVEICLDASVVPQLPTTFDKEGSLLQLDVTYSRISSALPVARYLALIFPKLTRILTSQENYPVAEKNIVHRLWKQVERSLTRGTGG
ncbi:hypothetical protein FB451DRAFT_1083417 [Mycena latifolia]|nr:hypothetical protein FB451DRAFT_1083417 [Mycena latifolia]